jgi:hypothetical protein
MSTNYYRLPTDHEMIIKKANLLVAITQLEMTPHNLERNFSLSVDDEKSWETETPWDKFIKGNKIHLGKRSGGWKFLWNFHNNKYYSNKEELLTFIRSGRVVDEYGDLQDTEEFIEMAMTWGQPNGHVYNKTYVELQRMAGHGHASFDSGSYDSIVDGLVVCSSTDFS